MPTYFKPLRRKLGVLTLVLACVFAVGWVRSETKLEGISFKNVAFNSIDGKLVCSRVTPWIGKKVLDWYSEDAVDENGVKSSPDYWKFVEVLWKTKVILGFEFGAGTFQQAGAMRMDICIIHYWSIVIPLTLASAWLLLSKPRARKPAEST